MMIKFNILGVAAMAVLASTVTSATNQDCGDEHEACCNGFDCNSSKLVCDKDNDTCLACGDDGQPPCQGNKCQSGFEVAHVDGKDVCEPCGEEGEAPCQGNNCRDGLVAFGKGNAKLCVECGSKNEPPCRSTGCEEGLHRRHIDGVELCKEQEVEEVACGGDGELPCDDTGCKNGAPAEAAGGVCVTGCGDPFWVCCDAPQRCSRHSLTCVDSKGEDLNGVPFTKACVDCGGEGEPICEEEGAEECEGDLVNVDGECAEEEVKEVDCGGIGELPCEDTGCDNDKSTSEASGGVCVTSCGEPAWTCCDGPSRCLRHSLTCIDKTGEDQDGVPFTMACVECGGNGEPICEEDGATECDDGLVNIDGKCGEEEVEEVACGGDGELPCDDTGCKNGAPAEAAGGVCVTGCGDPFWVCCDAPQRCSSHSLTCVDSKGEDLNGVPFTKACVDCGGEGEPICEEEGAEECEGGLVNVDGKCAEEEVKEVDCGGIGELPCDDTGCDNDKSPAEAAGGVCVTSCGDPFWVCCDAPQRCSRHSLTCVDSKGEDKDGVPFTQACVECGGNGEPICEEEGATECDDGLVNVDGKCAEEEVEEVDCGDIGELPCDDTGCDNDKSTSEASGGVCVTSCGEPAWTCCDGPSRCLRHSLTCVDKTGEDQDGVPFTQACVECGGNGEPICEEEGATECDDGLVNVDGKCAEEEVKEVDCGGVGEDPCKDTGCKNGVPAEAAGGVCVSGCGDPAWVCCDGPSRCQSHSLTCVNKVGEDLDGVLFKMSCVDCGGEGEPICEEEGAEECDDGLVNVDGKCTEEEVKEVDCGGIGELPCEDTGCDNDKSTSEASGGVCVTSCGEPAWTCCDAPSRCLRHSLTCVDSKGEDQDGVPFTQACVECGGNGEPICEEEGATECDDGLVNVDGKCAEEEVKEVDCGGIGELPCKETGCDNDKSLAEAAGGVCVTSCGDPFWVCCDAPQRCSRHTLTCVDSKGEDKDGVPFTQACVECGGEGEPICEEDGAEACEDGLVDVHGVCSHK